MHVSGIAVHRPVATTMLLLAAVLLGTVALTRLELTLLPEVKERDMSVWIPWSNAPVLESEQALARPVEDVLTTVRGVRSVRSRVVPGGVSLRLRLYDGADPEFVSLGLNERLESIRWSLPDGVGAPVILGGSSERAEMVLSLAADDLESAADWAKTVLRPRLEQVDGVARVEVQNPPQRELRVIADPDRLRSLGVSVDEIATALRRANVAFPGGYLRQRGVRYALRVDSELKDAAEIEDLVVARRSDRAIYLRDLARVEDGVREPDGWSRLDGRPAVSILVYREAGANLLKTADRLSERLSSLKSEFPEFEVSIIQDPAPFIRQSIGGLWQEVWLGALLAFGVLLYFLNDIRSPLILMTALPVSVLATFAVLEALGLSLNLMSMGGIALSIGMLVDNSIVCLENVHQHRARGLSPLAAAAQGAREVSMPMLASTLTTCCVFLPLAWVPGTLGSLFRDQAIAVTVSLLVSLGTALTLLPLLASRVETRPRRAERLPFFHAYHRVLAACLRHPRRFGATLAALLVLSGLILWKLPREILPSAPSHDLELGLSLPIGTDVSTTDLAVRELEGWLMARSEIERVHATVGAGTSGALIGAGESGREMHRALVRARLRHASAASRDRLVRELHAAFAGRPEWQLEVASAQPELMNLFSFDEATLAAEVTGPDPKRAEELAARIAGEATRLDGALARSLRLEVEEAAPQFSLAPRDDAFLRLAVDRDAATRAVQANASGYEATRLRAFDAEHPVVLQVRADTSARRGEWDGGTIVLGGRGYAARDLFAVQTELAPASLSRVDQARVAEIRWDGALRDVEGARRALNAAAANVGLDAGYSLRFTGSFQEMRETLDTVLRLVLLSALLVVLVLAAQFESVRLPLIIFTDIPLCLIGVALALFVTRGSLNVLSGVGLVILNGIVVNDSILKVDLLRRLQESGVSRLRAILIASRRRYRPILMTTSTTAFGLVPLFFGPGGALTGSLAATVIGGLVISTILTLLVVPVLFHGLARGMSR